MQQKEKKTQETAKQVYKKPQLGKITLVADHVLSCHTDAPCIDVPYGPSST
jgi:hypothetical protein